MIIKLRRKKRFLFITACLGFVLLSGDFYLYPKGLETLRMKQIHDILYNAYFPDDPHFTTIERIKRLINKEIIWWKIKNNDHIDQILSPLVDFKSRLPTQLKLEYPDVFQQGIKNVAPERVEEFRRSLMDQAPIEIQKKIILARQAWLYLIYSTPLAFEIAKVQPAVIDEGRNVDINLPQSRLFIEANEIKHKDGDIDYLIIGSGPAGSVIAHELIRQRQAKVVLIDAGSFIKPLCMKTEFNSNLIESHNLRRTVSGGIVIRNGQAVGGGTIVNIDLAFSPLMPQVQQKLQSWIDAGHISASLFHETKQDWYKLKQAYEWIIKHVHTRHVDQSEVNENNRLLLEGSKEARTYDLNERKPGVDGEILKISAVEAFLMPALLRNGQFKGELSIISDAKVERVEFEDKGTSKQVKGVRLVFREPYQHKCTISDSNNLKPVFQQSYGINAKVVILSAGALGSAEILLKSAIQNDNIGKGAILHPSMGVIGTFPKEINVLKGLSASVYAPAKNGSYIFEAMSAEPNFVAALHPGSGKDILETIRHFNNLGGFGVMLVDSVSTDNRVRINLKTMKSEVDYHLSNEDKKRFREGLSEAIRILLRQGAHHVFFPTSENIFGQSKYTPINNEADIELIMDQLSFKEGFNFISSAHMQATNKMSRYAKYGVVSPNFRVWDPKRGVEYPNLYICDSSVFPTSVGANPMQSIYTIAKLFTDQILLANNTNVH